MVFAEFNAEGFKLSCVNLFPVQLTDTNIRIRYILDECVKFTCLRPTLYINTTIITASTVSLIAMIMSVHP